MTANTSPIFALTPNVGFARLAAANTASDGSGTLGDLLTAGANGSRVDRINYHNSQATAAASSAMVVRIFITDVSNANPRLFDEFTVSANTRSTTVVGAGGAREYPGGRFIPSGTHLKVIQSVYAGAQDQMDYIAEAGDF